MKKKPKVPCKIPLCYHFARTRGMCDMHYSRWWRYGDPLFLKGSGQRIISWLKQNSVDKTDECIPWPFTKTQNGYGDYQWKHMKGARRVMCYLAYGEPPTLKHIAAISCGVRLCVNPRHLSWKTWGEYRAIIGRGRLQPRPTPPSLPRELRRR